VPILLGRERVARWFQHYLADFKRRGRYRTYAVPRLFRSGD